MSEEKAKQAYRGRLAPTPSGFLHQGHVCTFRTAWNRSPFGWGTLVFRMDDSILPAKLRNMPRHVSSDMHGHGFDWDEGPDKGGFFGPYNQSRRSKLYLKALRTLHDLGCIYPCLKTRREISAAGILDTRKEYLYPCIFAQIIPRN